MRYYKVIKENFLWEVGAILDTSANSNGYAPIDDVYVKHEDNAKEYISSKIVEDSPEYFQRVWKVNLATRVIYETKDKAKELIEKQFKIK